MSEFFIDEKIQAYNYFKFAQISKLIPFYRTIILNWYKNYSNDAFSAGKNGKNWEDYPKFLATLLNAYQWQL